MVGDFLPIDGAPRPGNIIVCILADKAEKIFQFLGKFFQHILIIVSDIAAISSGISGKFLLIKALQIVQGLLCAVPQQTVCIALERGEVIE